MKFDKLLEKSSPRPWKYINDDSIMRLFRVRSAHLTVPLYHAKKTDMIFITRLVNEAERIKELLDFILDPRTFNVGSWEYDLASAIRLGLDGTGESDDH